MPNLSSSILLKKPKRKPLKNPNSTTTTYLGYTLKPSSSWRTHAIQPLGNLLLLDHSPFNSRDTGLGSLRVLPDPLLLDLLALLSASDLLTLSMVSRAFYVFATHDPLWRPLVLDRWPLPGPFLFDGSWRRCFGQLRKKYRDFEGFEDKDNAFQRSSLENSGSRQCLGKEDKDDALGRCSRERDREIGRNSSETSVSEWCLRKKKRKFQRWNSRRDCKVVMPSGGLRIRDFYSDYLFQSWLCANIEMKPEWLEIDNIQRRRGISVAEFVSDFEEPNHPVLLEGCISHWPAMEKWDRERLIGVCEDVKFAVGSVEMRLEDYFRYANAASEERPLYLFDPRFAEMVPELGSDYDVPEYFRDDLFSVLGSERPDYRWIIIGPTGSGSSFHVDPNSTSAWNAIVRGAKKWVMFPPEVVPPGVYPSKDGADVACPVSIIEWFMNFYGACTESRRRPVECICRAGEVVFVPNGWWHLVINLEDSIAITQNYVSRRNLLNVLDFLNRPNASELVSGTTDRVNLYDKFKNAIESSIPGTIDQLRQKAQEKLEQKRKPTFWESVTDANVGGFKFSF